MVLSLKEPQTLAPELAKFHYHAELLYSSKTLWKKNIFSELNVFNSGIKIVPTRKFD